MKYFSITLLITIMCISGCKKEDCTDNPYSGTWKLTEFLFTLEDGTMTIEPIDSDKTLTFECDNNKVTSNGNLCTISPDNDNSSKGEYSMSDNQITPEGCLGTTVSIELFDNYLMLDYPCIGACKAKYEKQ